MRELSIGKRLLTHPTNVIKQAPDPVRKQQRHCVLSRKMWARVAPSSSSTAHRAMLRIRQRPGQHPSSWSSSHHLLPAAAAVATSRRGVSTGGGSHGSNSADPSQAAAVPADPMAVADAAGSWHAFVLDAAPVQGMQALLEGVQATTGLPWWASIALSTLAFRTALLPVVRYQARALARLAGAGPMLMGLNQALSQRLDKIRPGDVGSTTAACRAYAAGCSAALKAHRVSLLAAVASPLVQLPVFVTFALANRRMIDHAVPGLEAGGLAWFEDLTEPDPLLLLPLACLGSTYLNLELGFAKLHESQTVLRFIKDNLQLFLILGAPVSSTLPAGVFVYWLTSSLFGHAQHFALKSPAVRHALGFPPIPLPPLPPAPTQAQPQPQPHAAAGGMVVDPALMAKALEALDEYERRRERRLGNQQAKAQAGESDGKGPANKAPPGLSPFPPKK